MAKKRYCSGFSLVELVSVLILVGIVSIVVIARFDARPFQTASFDQELRSAIRFAQKFAIVSGCDVRVDIADAGNTYALWLRDDAVTSSDACLGASGAFGTPLNSPTGGAFAGSAPGSVDIGNDLTLFYDRRGSPSTGGTVTVDGRTITVEPVTGYVH